MREVLLEALVLKGVRKGRSLLALAGVAIGAGAVVAMLHTGHNARSAALKEFQALDWNILVISPEVSGERVPIIPISAVYSLTLHDIGIKSAAAIIQTSASIRAGRSSLYATVLAATDPIYDIAGLKTVVGRAASNLDGSAPFAVVGADIARSYAEVTGHALRTGDRIAASGRLLTVIGILAETPMSVILAIDFNRTILLPFGAANRVAPGSQIGSIVAELADGADDQKVADEVKKVIEPKMTGGRLSVHTARQLIESIGKQMRIYTLLIVGVGSISLIVGGVGIMNVMFMNVMERRKEIGLRQALGARRSHIRVMFLAEAVLQASLGSALGTLLGYIGAWAFAVSSGWSFEPSPLAPILGAGMAVSVGLIFGVLPAERAARLDPIAALRSD